MSKDFDEQQLDNLAFHHADGKPLVTSLVEDFQANGRRAMEIITTCAIKGDAECVKQCVHVLRSPAKTLGLVAFARACEELENSASAGLPLLRQVARVERLFIAACAWLAQQTRSVRAS